MKRIVVFTGAGVSEESGINTFRGITDGLWYDYSVEEVATIDAWKKDKEKVLDFHNMLRTKLGEVEPNKAHLDLASLDKYFDVTVVTQNVDDLHERAGQKNVLHLHGELTKVRSSHYNSKIQLDEKDVKLYDIGHGEINMGDKCEEHGSQLRPHTVLFGEYPFNVDEAHEKLMMADYLLIIGTSLQIGYTVPLLTEVNSKADVFYIDPSPVNYLDTRLPVVKVKEPATKGVSDVIRHIKEIEGFIKV